MSKIFRPDPVFINNLEELKLIEEDLHPKQYIQFICPGCGKFSLKRMWRLKYENSILFCRKCQIEKTNIKKYGFKTPTQSEKVKKKTKQTCLEKYGVESHNQLQSVKNKKKETTLKHYGVENPLQSEKIKEKVKQTCLKKYGVEYPTQFEKVKEKTRQTCIEKYGVTSPSQNPEVKDKIKQTFLNHFGVENPSQIKIIKEKKKQTCLSHYGVEYSFQSEKVKEKSKQTSLEKYGTENPTQSQLIKEKTKQTCLKRYGAEYHTQSQIVKDKIKQTLFDKYGMYHSPKKKYTYQNESFDSSWELAVWIWAKDVGKEIKREPVYFEYPFENEFHVYHPDFEIDENLIEIKGPQFFKKDGTMQNPFDHSKDALFEAKHQCGLNHGVEFWSEKEMQPVLEYMKNKYGKDYLKKFRNKS